MKTLIIIPTYNEATNIVSLLTDIFQLDCDLAVLVVDDSSPDGTAAKVMALQEKYPALHLLNRPLKQGLGPAYQAGFVWARERGFEAVIQMDADFSHSPVYLPTIKKALNDRDLIVGSRYVNGGGVKNWPFSRRLISRGGSLYARLILGSPIRDLTGGFNGWRLDFLQRLLPAKANGYCFQIELKTLALQSGARFLETPIIFEERQNGRSKLRGGIVWEAVWRVWQLKFSATRLRRGLGFLAIAAATVAVYWSSLTNQFLLWDDNLQIVANPDIQHFSWSNLYNIFSTFYVGMYQPLSSLLYALLYNLFGPAALAFHGASLILHLFNAWLVWRLFKILKQSDWLALLAAAVLGLHPMNVEAVAWASATSALLSNCFILLATISYLNYVDRGKRRTWWLTLLYFILAVLSKASGLIFPLIMPLLDYLKGRNLKNAWRDKLPFFLIAAVFAWLTFVGRSDAKHLTFQLWYYFKPLNYAVTILSSLGFYVIKFLAPFNLSAYYIYPPANPWLPWPYYLTAALTIIAVAGLIVWRRRLSKIVIFGWSWFAANLLLVLKIIPIGEQITADRYNYLPMLGLVLVAGHWLKPATPRLKRFLILAVVALLLFWGYLSYRQTALWQDNLTFFNRTIGQASHTADLYFLRADILRQAKQKAAALEDLNRAIDLYTPQISSKFAMAHNDRGSLLLEEFNQSREALADFDTAIRSVPDYALFYYNRGNAQVALNNCQAAITDFSRALELENNSSAAVFFNRGNCYLTLKQFPAAIADYQQTLRLSPDFAMAHMNQSLAFRALKQTDEACREARLAVQAGFEPARSLQQELCP